MRSCFAATLLAVLAVSAGAAAADPDRASPEPPPYEHHRLSLGASVSPWAAIASLGGDGHMRDGKALLGTGLEGFYGLRPLRYLEFGAGATYAHYLGAGRGGSYAHEVRLPLHVGVVVPIGARAELLLAGQIGWTHLWLPEQDYVAGGGSVLRATGLSFGPRVAGYFRLTEELDVFVETRAVWGLSQATNGVDYLEDVTIGSLALPTCGGVRARL